MIKNKSTKLKIIEYLRMIEDTCFLAATTLRNDFKIN